MVVKIKKKAQQITTIIQIFYFIIINYLVKMKCTMQYDLMRNIFSGVYRGGP